MQDEQYYIIISASPQFSSEQINYAST